MFYDNQSHLVKNKDVISFNDEDIESLYAYGYYLFSLGKYESSKEIFTFLTYYSPYRAFYWRALGAVNQTLKHYEEAINAYDFAIANDNRDVVSLVYRAETKLLLKRKEDALKDLENAVDLGENAPEYAPWAGRAKLLIKLNKNERQQ